MSPTQTSQSELGLFIGPEMFIIQSKLTRGGTGVQRLNNHLPRTFFMNWARTCFGRGKSNECPRMI